DEVSQRRARASRALELRVERARYDATRAERAFALCDPENRLVARSLESRWEQKLRDLHDAETELAAEPAPAPQPTRDEIETLAPSATSTSSPRHPSPRSPTTNSPHANLPTGSASHAAPSTTGSATTNSKRAKHPAARYGSRSDPTSSARCANASPTPATSPK